MPSLRALAELVRAPAALSVPGDLVAEAAAAGTLDRRTPAAAAASICLYWAGMAANDWADRARDTVERPERPIPSGRVRPGQAVALAAGLTAAGLGLAALAGGRRALTVAVPLAGAIWAYDLAAKSTPAGPAVMALCRGLGVLLGGAQRPGRALPAALTVAAHTYTVTELSRREVSGAGRALPAATLAGTAAIAAVAGRRPEGGWRGSAGPGQDGWRGVLPTALAGWYAAQYGAAQARALADPSAGPIRAAVGAGIVGLPQLQGALAARHGAPLAGLAVAALGPAARWLARRVSPT